MNENDDRTMNAAEHATRASELLLGVTQIGEWLDQKDDDARHAAFLEVADELRWSAELARSHALTALALKATQDT